MRHRTPAIIAAIIVAVGALVWGYTLRTRGTRVTLPVIVLDGCQAAETVPIAQVARNLKGYDGKTFCVEGYLYQSTEVRLASGLRRSWDRRLGTVYFPEGLGVSAIVDSDKLNLTLCSPNRYGLGEICFGKVRFHGQLRYQVEPPVGSYRIEGEELKAQTFIKRVPRTPDRSAEPTGT